MTNSISSIDREKTQAPKIPTRAPILTPGDGRQQAYPVTDFEHHLLSKIQSESYGSDWLGINWLAISLNSTSQRVLNTAEELGLKMFEIDNQCYVNTRTPWVNVRAT